MKRFFLFVLLIVLWNACTSEKEFNTLDAQKLAQELKAEHLNGRISLTTTADNEYFVFYGNENESKFSKAFVVQFDKAIEAVSFNGDSEVILLEEGFVVMNSELGIRYFGAANSGSANNVKQIEDIIGSSLKSYLGFGFSYFRGEWKEDADVNLNSARNILSTNSLIAERAEITDGKVSCTSGGAGSASCSIENPLTACSVSCQDGYYACCVSSTTQCFCTQNGKDPELPKLGD